MKNLPIGLDYLINEFELSTYIFNIAIFIVLKIEFHFSGIFNTARFNYPDSFNEKYIILIYNFIFASYFNFLGSFRNSQRLLM